jgi:hypothetical protein
VFLVRLTAGQVRDLQSLTLLDPTQMTESSDSRTGRLSELLRGNIGLFVGLVVASYIALRLLVVADFDPMIALTILQEQGTGAVILGTLVAGASVVPALLLAPIGILLIAYIDGRSHGPQLLVVSTLFVVSTFVLSPWFTLPLSLVLVLPHATYSVKFRRRLYQNATVAQREFEADIRSVQASIMMVEALQTVLWSLIEYLRRVRQDVRNAVASDHTDVTSDLDAWEAGIVEGAEEIASTRSRLSEHQREFDEIVKSFRLPVLSSESYGSRFIWLPTSVVACFLVAASLFFPPWLPSERIDLHDGSYYVGFVLNGSGDWVSVMDEGRNVHFVSADSVTSREACSGLIRRTPTMLELAGGPPRHGPSVCDP